MKSTFYGCTCLLVFIAGEAQPAWSSPISAWGEADPPVIISYSPSKAQIPDSKIILTNKLLKEREAIVLSDDRTSIYQTGGNPLTAYPKIVFQKNENITGPWIDHLPLSGHIVFFSKGKNYYLNCIERKKESRFFGDYGAAVVTDCTIGIAETKATKPSYQISESSIVVNPIDGIESVIPLGPDGPFVMLLVPKIIMRNKAYPFSSGNPALQVDNMTSAGATAKADITFVTSFGIGKIQYTPNEFWLQTRKQVNIGPLTAGISKVSKTCKSSWPGTDEQGGESQTCDLSLTVEIQVNHDPPTEAPLQPTNEQAWVPLPFGQSIPYFKAEGIETLLAGIADSLARNDYVKFASFLSDHHLTQFKDGKNYYGLNFTRSEFEAAARPNNLEKISLSYSSTVRFSLKEILGISKKLLQKNRFPKSVWASTANGSGPIYYNTRKFSDGYRYDKNIEQQDVRSMSLYFRDETSALSLELIRVGANWSIGALHANPTGLTPTPYVKANKSPNQVPETPFISELRAQARRGNAEAQVKLGVCYVEGKGVASDDDEAVVWFKKAADLGSAKAKFQLGQMCLRGRGMTRDEVEALRWFREAAEQGNADGQYALAQLIYPEDIQEGLKWYQFAATQGHSGAQCDLGRIYLGHGGIKADYAEAAKWFRLAADKGDDAALVYLGECREEGKGVAQDLAEAVRLYRMAADHGYSPAQRRLGLCYAQGKGVPQDDTEAYVWMMLSRMPGQMPGGGPGIYEDKDLMTIWERLSPEARMEAAARQLKRLAEFRANQVKP